MKVLESKALAEKKFDEIKAMNDQLARIEENKKNLYLQSMNEAEERIKMKNILEKQMMDQRRKEEEQRLNQVNKNKVNIESNEHQDKMNRLLKKFDNIDRADKYKHSRIEDMRKTAEMRLLMQEEKLENAKKIERQNEYMREMLMMKINNTNENTDRFIQSKLEAMENRKQFQKNTEKQKKEILDMFEKMKKKGKIDNDALSKLGFNPGTFNTSIESRPSSLIAGGYARNINSNIAHSSGKKILENPKSETVMSKRSLQPLGMNSLKNKSLKPISKPKDFEVKSDHTTGFGTTNKNFISSKNIKNRGHLNNQTNSFSTPGFLASKKKEVVNSTETKQNFNLNRESSKAFYKSQKANLSDKFILEKISTKRTYKGRKEEKKLSEEEAIEFVNEIRNKLQRELLDILETEQKKENEREEILNSANDDDEKIKLEKRFGIERAIASDKIMKISESNDKKIASLMKKYKLVEVS